MKILQGLCCAALLLFAQMAAAKDFIILQSTTSTQNSGLFDAILPLFEQASGIEVRVVAVGTGQALKNAQHGDGDVVLVHAKSAEEQFVAQGYGLSRADVMYNDFVVVGPSDDPAGVGQSTSIAQALQRIAGSQSRFVSRGDDSGTHKAEMRLWDAAGLDPLAQSGKWYSETGSGMGATLNIASGMNAYTLTDRGTWIAFANKGNLALLFEGDEKLFNQYGVIVVNPSVHRVDKSGLAQRLADWLLSTDGQSAIAAYRVQGQQLFFPNAKRN